MAVNQPKTFAEKMQLVPRQVLFLLLIILTALPLLFLDKLVVPDVPEDAVIDIYSQLMKIPEGSTILVCSDWTNSSRGESAPSFEALIRILMRRHVKAAIYSFSDAQAPQVARNTISRLNEEAKLAGQPIYRPWEDYVVLGFFPNAEGTATTMAINLRNAFSGRKDVPPGGQPTDVFESPVLKNTKGIGDMPLLAIVTATNSSQIQVQRLSAKAKLVMLVTGVMGPETQVYYQASQIKGLVKGLKGDYDLEYLMENGVNWPDYASAKVKSEKYKDSPVPNFPGQKNLARAASYILTLHFAMGLLILAVIVGNVGMFLSRKRGRA